MTEEDMEDEEDEYVMTIDDPGEVERLMNDLEHFRAKWEPVRVKKMR